jgi:hypothetical protein
MAIIWALFLSIGAGIPVVQAHTPPIPDPPNAITWQPIAIKRVSPPKIEVPEDCPQEYRGIVETGFQLVWQSCEALGQKPPSDCQRASFDKCVTIATRLRSLQTKTCHSYKEFARIVGHSHDQKENQKSSQEKNSELNESAARALGRLAEQIESDRRELDRLKREASDLVAQPMCKLSSALVDYQPVYQKIAQSLNDTGGRLESLARKKRSEASGHIRISENSSGNAAGLTTTNKANVSGPGGSSTAASPVGSAPGADLSSSGSNNSAWLPAAAVAAPIVLGGLMVAKDSANGGALVGGGGGRSGPILPPGAGFVAANGLFLDPALTDQQRTIVAIALQKVPECHRQHLRGIAIRSANLGGRRGGNDCVAGLWQLRGSRQTISLDPNCSFSIGVVVHEFMHSLGHRAGEKLHRDFRTIVGRHGNCPVSAYGATSFVEDFAEAGRLAVYPESGGQNAGQCVANKVRDLASLLRSCR